MPGIMISKPSQEELQSWGISTWSSWECPPSQFDWEYSDHESAYVFEGEVTVEADGVKTKIQGGDLVHFPKGLQCHWHVHQTIRKVYTFSHPNCPFNK